MCVKAKIKQKEKRDREKEKTIEIEREEGIENKLSMVFLVSSRGSHHLFESLIFHSF